MNELITLLIVNYICFFVIITVAVMEYINDLDETDKIIGIQLIKSKRQVLLYLIPFYFMLDMISKGIKISLKNFKKFYDGLK